ncbi:DEAD/DEAH box helicase [Campylobacter sputorum]|uniref:DEAD/DEAH box helicase n=1 Tax=Campylobacter sputorum TaxID=206 RepID=UPI00053BE442|nr:ATP-binding domain-containing protein [Campylobacter sputorum]
MKNSQLFFQNIKENELNKQYIECIKKYYGNNFKNEQLYLLNKPLGENIGNLKYDYENKVIVILSPKHKIIFLNLDSESEDDFERYYDDFIDDLGFLSKKFNYEQKIGRTREWKRDFTSKKVPNNATDVNNIFKNCYIENTNDQRKIEFLISLLTGSINDIENIKIEDSENLLDKIKNKIVLFDTDQTNFIYKPSTKDDKIIQIQGLSGTGKTELLLHKLKQIYTSRDDLKVFFTCHNITLANLLKERIPAFFNFMKVEKQIEWNKQLWVDRAWGSESNPNSGLYSYICKFYNIDFLSFKTGRNYENIFKIALENINKIKQEDFEFAFDYILIDERQDFPDVFFELCKKITKYKVYAAGDIFQNIFDYNISSRVDNVDYILNRCYRTEPKTLMFAQAVGMGLFEEKKLNWLKDEEWKMCGYNIERLSGYMHLSRDPIRRFEDIDSDKNSVIIKQIDLENGNEIINIIEELRISNPTIKPEDIAIIMLDNDKYIYKLADKLEQLIAQRFNWGVSKGYIEKRKIQNTLHITNTNNAKGLEFPFVLCISKKLMDDYRYRNSFYTMMTRSFIQSYFLVNDNTNLDKQQDGLKIINENNHIKTKIPSEKEMQEIENTIIKVNKEINISFEEFLTNIFNEQKIDRKHRNKLKKIIIDFNGNNFDKEKIIKIISANRNFL